MTVALLAVFGLGIAIANRDDEPTTAPTTTAPPQTTTTLAVTSTSTAGTSTTVIPAPASVVAGTEQKVVLLESATGRVIRTLFDLGPSQPTDTSPASIGTVAVSADGQTAFFDVIGGPAGPTMRRVQTRGGQPEDIGAGRSPTPSPDGSTLAFVRPGAEGADTIVLRSPSGERTVNLTSEACGNLAWSPDGRRSAVGLCREGQPTTVAEVDLGGAQPRAVTFTPPSGVRWGAPSYRPDGVLTLAEERTDGTVVVQMTDGRPSGDILRRDRATLVCLDWALDHSLLFCEADGSVWVAPGRGDPSVVATGYASAAW